MRDAAHGSKLNPGQICRLFLVRKSKQLNLGEILHESVLLRKVSCPERINLAGETVGKLQGFCAGHLKNELWSCLIVKTF